MTKVSEENFSFFEKIAFGKYEPGESFSWTKDKDQYLQEQGRLERLFKADLLSTYEVSDNPKADKCYALAWEYGHASGYHDIAHHFGEFVTLIK